MKPLRLCGIKIYPYHNELPKQIARRGAFPKAVLPVPLKLIPCWRRLGGRKPSSAKSSVLALFLVLGAHRCFRCGSLFGLGSNLFWLLLCFLLHSCPLSPIVLCGIFFACGLRSGRARRFDHVLQHADCSHVVGFTFEAVEYETRFRVEQQSQHSRLSPLYFFNRVELKHHREICASKSGLIIFCPKRGRRDRHVQRTIECIMFFRGATVVVTTVLLN
mmetsp:Transcript_19302/g.77236  ORF Transcript_19302/g.77236 Transcript_19302/m.77236 type:complete len:218 (-) Transcript_19302:912-1565(-)